MEYLFLLEQLQPDIEIMKIMHEKALFASFKAINYIAVSVWQI